MPPSTLAKPIPKNGANGTAPEADATELNLFAGFAPFADMWETGMRRWWNLTRHVMGIDRAPVGQTPRDAVWSNGKAVLYRYRSENPTVRPPLLLVMSLVSRSFILDLQPGNSFIERLVAEGFDVFLLDWGVPDEEEANNTLETYCDELLPQAVAEVNQMGGENGVTVFGYCYGGLLSLLYAAGHPDDPVRNLVVMATPVDFTKMPAAMTGVGKGGIHPEHLMDHTGNVPAEAVRASFTLLTPTSDLSTVMDFWEHLDDDKFLSSYQAMTSWTRNHIPFPGATMIQTVEMFNEGNGFVTGDLMLGGRKLDLAGITAPFLNVIAERDHIVPPESTYGLDELVGSDDATEMRLPAGHVGLIVGNGARKRSIPSMIGWMLEHSDVES